MHLAQIVIKFTSTEKYELENIIAPNKTQPKEGKPTQRSKHYQQDLEFKNVLVNFIRSAKNTMQDRNRCLDRLRDFLVEQKCIQDDGSSLLQSTGNDCLVVGLQNLRMKISQMQKNNKVFQLFVGCLEEMKNLHEEHIYEFEYKLSKATILSRMERETLAMIAKRIVKVDSLGRMADLQDDISAFLTKIMRYGIHQEFKELQKITSSQIKNKCIKLVEYLQGNCIQMKQEFNPVRSLLKKLSISIYDKSQITSSLSELPQNVRTIFEPLCAEVFRLRDSSMKTSIIGETGLIYVSHDMKRAQDQNLETMRREKQEIKRKCTALEDELKHTKFILEKLGHMSNLFREENLYQTIEGQLGNTSEQVKIYLQRIYSHLKSFEELTLGARKASFIERKDNQIEFLQEKLSVALQELDVLRTNKFSIQETESLLLDENNELQNRTSQNERLILQYQSEMSSLNAQISTYSKEINKLSGELLDSQKQIQLFMKEIAEMQRQIDRMMNMRKDQETQHEKELTIANQQLESQIKVLKEENASLLQKCQERAAEHIQLEEKTKEVASLKYFQAQNAHLMDLINRLNAEIKAKQFIINQHQLFPFPKLDESIQTLQQQCNSALISKLSNQIKQLTEQKAKLQSLQTENEQLKEERLLRLNEQIQMKRVYRQSKEEHTQLQEQLISYKQQYEKLAKEYDILKKKHNQIRLQEFERKLHSQKTVTSEGSTDFERQNLKKMQEKHRLLQKNFEEVKKYNELIKTQYHKLKQETNHVIKAKVKDLLQGSRQNQIRYKRQLEKSAMRITDLNAKVTILQQQNLNLKVQLQGKAHQRQNLSDLRQRNESLTQSLNFPEQRQASRSKEKLKDEIRSLKIRNEKEHMRMVNELRAKDEEISSQRIQILRLQQKIDHLHSQMSKMDYPHTKQH